MSPLSIFFLTFNCGRALIDVDSFSATLSDAFQRRTTPNHPDIIVLSLQEIAPYTESFLGSSFLAPYFSRFIQSVNKVVAPEQEHGHLISRNVGMTAIVVIAIPAIVQRIKWITTAGVGVGDYGLGNKGAVAVRLCYEADHVDQPVVLTFVAAHLAPSEDAWKRRNEDWQNIVQGLSFSSDAKAGYYQPLDASRESASESDSLLASNGSSRTSSGMFIASSPVFFGGDLNYRTRDIGPTPEDTARFPQPGDTNSSGSRFSIEDLKQGDQLNRERKAGRTLHLLDEAPFDFPPTYKYSEKASQSWPKDGSEPKEWLWSEHRFPSFCDRILFSSFLSNPDTNPLKVHSYNALPLQSTSDHRPVTLEFELDLASEKWKALANTSEIIAPFPLNPHSQRHRAAARWRETVVGAVTYLGLTWSGNGLLAASLLGAVGGWAVIRALVA